MATRILANGTKQFTYTLSVPDNYFDGDADRVSSQAPDDAQDREVKRQENIERRIRKRVDATGFCKKGYIVLSREFSAGSALMRGECNDSVAPATPQAF